MLKVKSIVIAAVVCLAPLATHAETVVCPTEADTYMLHGGMYYGYPDRGYVRSTNWVGGEALFRFDLSDLAGYAADDIISATFKAYTAQGSGMMAHPMAPAGTTQRAQVMMLRTWDPDVHPHGLTNWTEALRGDYEHGYIDGSVESQSGLPNIYDPGDVGGHDPYHWQDHGLNPGDPRTILSHNTGPYTWASVDLTDFVKAWLPGGDMDVDNNGIRIHDLGGWSGSPDPAFPEEHEWGWYFYAKDVGGSDWGITQPHPGAGYVPYLQVDVVPEPSTIALLCSGGLALLWLAFRRRKRLKGA